MKTFGLIFDRLLQNLTQETSHSFPVDRITVLKKDIRDVEEQEMEAIREVRRILLNNQCE